MMQDLHLHYVPDAVLHRACSPVQEGLFGTPALIDLAREMLSKLEPWAAIGLAAPQIGEPMQLFVVQASISGHQVVINPVVVRRGKKNMADEGCLSEPGKARKVMRYNAVSWTGRNEHGDHIGGELHAYPARVFQHEADHLAGLLIEDTWVGAKRERDESVSA